MGRNLCYLRKSGSQRHRGEYSVPNSVGGNGDLRVRRPRSAKHSARPALLAELATIRRIMEGAANHRYWISRCVLFEIRHVSTEFSAARSGDICELSPWPGPSTQLLSQQLVGSVRISVVGAAAQRR